MSEPRDRVGSAGARNLHPPGEGDPEQLAGEAMPDPWDDPDQADWPNEQIVELPGEESGR